MQNTKPCQVLAPTLTVSSWVQGKPLDLEQLIGRVVLLEVFQVNCPGCFLYSLPQAVKLHYRYVNQGLTVIGLATAFEDFDKNTLENLQELIKTGKVVGETRRLLAEHNQLRDGLWPVRLPFSIAMDRLLPNETLTTYEEIESFIQKKIPEFSSRSSAYKALIRKQMAAYLAKLQYHAETFERYELKGTPSQILINKQGIRQYSRFGHYPELERDIQDLLAEQIE